MLLSTMERIAETPEASAITKTELDLLRIDLEHQLGIPDELDWDYFLETAKRAKVAADAEGRNMTLHET